MKLADYIQGIPKTIRRGACVLGLAAITALPLSGLEQSLDNSSTQAHTNQPHHSMQIGGTLRFPHLISLRFVYGWDKRVGFQADISPFFVSADMRLRHEEYSRGPWNMYGFLGGMVLNPLMRNLGEPDSPTYAINFGAGVERETVLLAKLREKLFKNQSRFEGYVGAEFGLVIPIEIPTDTVGMRMNINGGWRF